uniref:DYW domain-containing protein n=1 Tax=Kalanchoe fedtschenkoi TaxID=63787 RepID=A0A7N0VL34_KALFE
MLSSLPAPVIIPPASPMSKAALLSNFNSPLELKQIQAHFIKTQVPLNAIPVHRIASVCALTPDFAHAQQFFDYLGADATDVWNSCLKELAESGAPIGSILLFYKLRLFGVRVDCFTCSFVLKACLKMSDLRTGRVVHGLVEKLGMRSNLFLMNAILNLYGACGASGDAGMLFDKMSERDVVTWNTRMTQFVKGDDADGAYQVFCGMPERNLRSWTCMIAGYVQCGKPKEAIDLFARMEEAGVRPNEVTVVSVLAACADLGALDLGRRIHEYSSTSGFGKNVCVSNTLIDMYVKCGFLEDAQKVFDGMEERTVVSWSAIIGGRAMHGQAAEALRLFNEMVGTGMKPNGVTFVGLLHACSHMGLVDLGRTFFMSMEKDYGIVPKIEHYGCMVDLYSRAGLLDEAHKFIINMPIEPNGVVWGALLGGCSLHKNIELAEEAFEHLLELDPLNDGYYVVLSNIYADAQRWEDTTRVRLQGGKKTPGWSSITLNGTVNEFVAGDEAHPQSDMIFRKWDSLLEQMKLKGYVPNTSVVLIDVEESEKEKYLFRHSEKLALGFGLINTTPGTPIRIMKNLRVCQDCHEVMKLISAMTNRDIIVRDRNRFHHFRNGSCSCRDYW